MMVAIGDYGQGKGGCSGGYIMPVMLVALNNTIYNWLWWEFI